jgi:hypothetical protein
MTSIFVEAVLPPRKIVQDHGRLTRRVQKHARTGLGAFTGNGDLALARARRLFSRAESDRYR